MAGFIHLSIGVGFPISSRTFNVIVEKTREYLGNNNCYTQKIYEPLDEGGLDIISLEEQEEEGFNAFYNATVLAMEQYKFDTKMSSEYLLKEDLIYKSWKELLDLIIKDNRYVDFTGKIPSRDL
jgi:hypothetical protein